MLLLKKPQKYIMVYRSFNNRVWHILYARWGDLKGVHPINRYCTTHGARKEGPGPLFRIDKAIKAPTLKNILSCKVFI